MRGSFEYENPWHRPGDSSPKIYNRKDVIYYPSECGRGMIIKVLDRHYDYLVDGKVITQRCGKSMDILNKLIATNK